MAARDDLIALGFEATLWHDAEMDAFATIEVNGHEENHRVRSKPFKLWLAGRYHRAIGQGAPRGALEDAFCTMEAEAIHSGPEHQVALRIAEHAGAVYIDIVDANWRAVRIDSQGWEVVPASPVKFIRSRGMGPLPLPSRGGSIGDLRRFVNVGSDDGFKLMAGWLLGAFKPTGPYPILILNGEHGSAKSTTARVLRRLIDPNLAEIRAVPRTEQDLMVAARNSWVICLDNLSFVQTWLSDAMCRLATGGGYGARELYKDADEIIFEAQRPILLNGIPDLANRPDLADRSIVQLLPSISDEHRQELEYFWREFDLASSSILGALMNAVSVALARKDEVVLKRKPRMADFGRWVTAAEPACGWADGSFISAYSANRENAIELTIEADAVARLIRDLTETEPIWDGTATDLLERLNNLLPMGEAKPKGWPVDASKLSGAVRRAAPALRQVGIGIEQKHRRGRSYIEIRKGNPYVGLGMQSASTASTTSTESPPDGGGRGSRGKMQAQSSEDFTDPNTWGLDSD